MEKICLGPTGTFSELALAEAWNRFSLPESFSSAKTFYAPENKDVIPLLMTSPGRVLASLATHTLARGYITKSFNQLAAITPPMKISIIGAIELPVSFALLGRRNGGHYEGVFAHEQAKGACAQYLHAFGLPIYDAGSNAQAAELVATMEMFSRYLALAPTVCARLYGLDILETKCEDDEARTIFYILGRGVEIVDCSNEWRALIVVNLKRKIDLAKVLYPLAQNSINISFFHRVRDRRSGCQFCIEVEGFHGQLPNARQALEYIRSIPGFSVFWPFPLVRL